MLAHLGVDQNDQIHVFQEPVAGLGSWLPANAMGVSYFQCTKKKKKPNDRGEGGVGNEQKKKKKKRSSSHNHSHISPLLSLGPCGKLAVLF